MADDTQLAEATQPLSFAEFLERMKEPAAADLVRSIKKCDASLYRMCLQLSSWCRSIDAMCPVCLCSFIKTFDERKPDPERDSGFVQVSTVMFRSS